MKKYLKKGKDFIEKFLTIQKNLICIRSLPNYSDEVYWISEYTNKYNLQLIILHDNSISFPIWAEKRHIKNINYKSIKGVYFFLKSNIVIYTHGIYAVLGKKKKGITINIWHGMPLKKIGTYKNVPNEELPKFDIMLADREKFVPIMAKAFFIEENSVIISPSPRIDSLSHDITNRSVNNKNEKIKILWLPTFRSSYTGEDGKFVKLPFVKDKQLSLISSILEKYNAICYVKLHPLSQDDFSKVTKYSNIQIIKDTTQGKSLYLRVRESDMIITDYSSIMFDLDHIEKKLILYTPDILEYKMTVGFIESILADIEVQFIIEFSEFLDCFEMKLKTLKNNLKYGKQLDKPRGYWTEKMFKKLYELKEIN